jgi:hypothetical protein
VDIGSHDHQLYLLANSAAHRSDRDEVVSEAFPREAQLQTLKAAFGDKGRVGRSYLEPYLERSVGYLIPVAIWQKRARAKPIATFDGFGAR